MTYCIDLSGKVAIVTGAAKGIGEATARILAQAGAQVVIDDVVPEETVVPVLDKIAQVGPRPIYMRQDISVEDNAKALVQETLEKLGRIDILINNAGVVAGWEKSFDVHVMGVFYCSEAVKDHMAARGNGKIVILTSTCAHSGGTGIPQYVATKGGAYSLTRYLARTYAPLGILVNGVMPAVIMSDMIMTRYKTKEEMIDHYTPIMPIRRIGYPEDVAGIILFLCSDLSNFLCGEIIVADGGRMNVGIQENLMKTIVEELEHLTSIPALSGMEDRMITEMVNQFQEYTDDIHVDRLGNVTATFQGRIEGEPTLMFFAHIDELGLMITKIEPNGYLRFDRIGGVPEKTLRGAFVDVHSIDGKQIFTGFVGTHAHHLTPPDLKLVVPTTDKMYIDLGFPSAEEALACGIRAGSAVTYHPHFLRVGQHHITSKALDNRIGVLLLLRLAEHLKKHPPKATIYLVASVQEEFNIRGNMPVFTRLEPNAAICLDITSACDTPDLNMRYDISLGKGPAVLQMNFHGRGTLAGLIPNPKFRLFIENLLEEMEIPYQRQTIIGEITDDAFTLVLGKLGTAMTHISIPMRYSHSPIETSDLRDIQAGIRLVLEIADRFDHTLDLQRGNR